MNAINNFNAGTENCPLVGEMRDVGQGIA